MAWRESACGWRTNAQISGQMEEDTMNKLLTTCAALALGGLCLSPVYAQDTSAPAAPAPQTQQAAPSQSLPMQSDLTGQTIYTKSGTKIGAVTSVTTDAQGQQQAVVSIEKFLGMGGKSVLFPADSLQSRSSGGYTTSLTSAEIKNLPAAAGTP